MRRVGLAWLLVALLCAVGRAQTMGGSIFDETWDKSHPPSQSAPPAPAGRQPTDQPAPPGDDGAAAPQITPTAGPRRTVRAPVPDATAQRDIEKDIREVFGDQIAQAKTPAAKAALAQAFLDTALQTHRHLTARYVLCRMAADWAAETGQADIALKSVDAMWELHDIDPLQVKLETLTRLLRTVEPGACAGLYTQTDALVDAAVSVDRYGQAEHLAAVASALAGRSGDAALMRQAHVHEHDVGAIASAAAAIGPAQAMLVVSPKDPLASADVGRYYCFFKGDWDQGLGLLAQGNDGALKNLAARELADPQDADEQAQIADAWWALAQKQNSAAQRQIRLHAGQWYEQALPHLSGLMALKAQKRLADLKATLPPDDQ